MAHDAPGTEVGVVGTLGQQLLRRLRRRAPTATNPPIGYFIAPGPTVGELLPALQAARSGRADDSERAAMMLLAADADPASDAARAAAEAFLSDAEPRVWRNLDVATRRSWWTAPASAASARERVSSGQAGLLSLVVASSHPSGHVREAATARLAEFGGPLVVRALAMRSADWVPQVRARARMALRAPLTTPGGLLAAGPMASALGARFQGRWLAEHVEIGLADLSDIDLAQVRRSPDPWLRRLAYTVALEGQRLDIAELLQAAQHDSDLVIRVRCSDAAVRSAAARGDLGQIRPLLASGTAAARMTAVSALARAGDTGVAFAALPDRNPAVREVAQGQVRATGAERVTAYRDMLAAAGDSPDPGIIAGLGETGGASDAELVTPALTHPLPRGRVEAVRALRRLGAVDTDSLVPLLSDWSPSVTRQVALTLRPYVRRLDPVQLQPLLDYAEAGHVRIAAYRVFKSRDVWTRIQLDLQLYEDADERLRNLARVDLATWLNRDAATTYSMPSGAVKDELEQLVRQRAEALGPKRERFLRFNLGLNRADQQR
jgi:hypothetical protein